MQKIENKHKKRKEIKKRENNWNKMCKNKSGAVI